MKITLNELRALISEAVRTKLTEGTKEIPIRMVMDDMKAPVVESLTEELMKEISLEEVAISGVVGKAYDKMVMEVVRELDDKPGLDLGPGIPRRRVVGIK